MSDKLEQKPRVSYSEMRTINIGDYESIKASLTISHDAISQPNSSTTTLTIQDGAVADVEDGDVSGTVDILINNVSAKLNKREIRIRKWAAEFTELDFDTLDKSPKRKKRKF
jgi:hypothetical protein